MLDGIVASKSTVVCGFRNESVGYCWAQPSILGIPSLPKSCERTSEIERQT